MPSDCRCGHPASSPEPHPCHGKAYTCKAPATQRFYNPRPVALAGAQLKFEVTSTWACDSCWVDFKVLLEKQNAS